MINYNLRLIFKLWDSMGEICKQYLELKDQRWLSLGLRGERISSELKTSHCPPSAGQQSPSGPRPIAGQGQAVSSCEF